MTASPLDTLSFPERQTISPCQRATRPNGFSVKDVRVLVLVMVEDQWVPGKEPLSTLIAMKTPSSLVYKVAGGIGTL